MHDKPSHELGILRSVQGRARGAQAYLGILKGQIADFIRDRHRLANRAAAGAFGHFLLTSTKHNMPFLD
jgi:hypothetical protein